MSRLPKEKDKAAIEAAIQELCEPPEQPPEVPSEPDCEAMVEREKNGYEVPAPDDVWKLVDSSGENFHGESKVEPANLHCDNGCCHWIHYVRAREGGR
jgi:hypothetical protein